MKTNEITEAIKYEKGKHPNSLSNLKLGNKKLQEIMRSGIRSREKNNKWKGDNASYTAFHHWLKYYYGKANHCENPTCIYPRLVRRRGSTKKILITEPKLYNWSLIKGKHHSQKRENYIQLCASCHEFYDKGNLDLNI